MEAENRGTALVTGASSGIGEAYARKLAARGYGLILVARRKNILDSVAAEVRERYGVKAEALAADLSEPKGVASVERRIAGAEDLTMLVNNAGFGTTGKFADADLKKQLDMIHVHVVAPARLCRAALPPMVSRGRGAIVNVASISAFVTSPGEATYCATKAYLVSFSKTLQAELEGTGVVVQALCPGVTRTGFHSTPECRGFDSSIFPESLWMTADEVVDSSLNSIGRGVVHIPGLRNKVFAYVPYSMFLYLKAHRLFSRPKGDSSR